MKRIINLIFCLFIFVSFLNAQHLKKDGTPDMRYKENKISNYSSYSLPTTSKSYNYSGQHLKKDGTPDKRYKENKTSNNSSVKRDANGKILRSETAKHEFMRQTGYPHGRKGYVVDHIIPLKKGGCDCPANMQWQTIEQSKAKDKWE